MGVNVGDWYSDPAQRYNDVIFPQKDRIQRERDHGRDDWGRYDRRASKADRAENAPAKELSAEAKKLLDKLKATYKNVDFSVAESEDSDDAKAKLAGGTKQYSVLLTNDELEQMAKDQHYRTTMLSRMRDAFQEITKESERLKAGGIDPATNSAVKSLSVKCNICGNYSVRKELADTAQTPQTAQTVKTPVERYQEKQAQQKREHPGKPPVGRREPHRKPAAGKNEPPKGPAVRKNEPPKGPAVGKRDYNKRGSRV